MTDSFRNMTWMGTDRESTCLVIDNWILSLSFITTKEVVHIQTNAPCWLSQAGFIDPKVSVMVEEFVFITWSTFPQLIVVSPQTVHNAVTMLCGTEQLIGSLPEVKWAQQVRSLSTELQEESLRVIVQHLPQVIRTQSFQDLRRVSQHCSSGGLMLLMSVVWQKVNFQQSFLCYASTTQAITLRFLVKTLIICVRKCSLKMMHALSWVRLYCSGLHPVCGFLSFCFTSFQREEFTREPTLLKKLCSAIREGATVDNCCDLFTAVQHLCGDDMDEDLLQERQPEEVRWRWLSALSTLLKQTSHWDR